MGGDGEGVNRGAACIFTRNEGGADSWSQLTKLTASGAEDHDQFGRSVAISGDTVVGAHGGDGTGSSTAAGIDCGAHCTPGLAQGTAVTLKAVPTAGSTFDGWGRAGCSGASG